MTSSRPIAPPTSLHRAPFSDQRPRRLALLLTALLLTVLAGCGGSAAAVLPAGPLMAANAQASVFVEPDDGPEPILREIDQAARTIDLEVYLLTDRPIIAALERAARRGVRVRVLLEQHPFGNGPGNQAVYSRLRRARIAVEWADPRFKLTHEKALVIDAREALILTLNLTASAFSRNREYGSVDSTPADVAEVEAIFQADWNRTGYAPSQPDLVVSPDNSRTKLLGLIAQASHKLDVESEEVQDPGVEGALLAASRRGVRVRLVVSPSSSSSANARGERRLEAGGVQVHFMRRPFVHAKLFVVDARTAFAGSENISRQSLDANRELGLLLSQPAAVVRLESTFRDDWRSHS